MPRSVETNPYASPAEVAEQSQRSAAQFEAQLQRTERLSQEANFRHLTLALIGIFAALSCVVFLPFMLNFRLIGVWQIELAIALVSIPCTLLGIVAYVGVRRFLSWAKTSMTILSIVALPVLPLGTIIGLSLLYDIHIGRWPRLLSPKYQAIVAATPELSKRTSVLSWIGAFFLLILVATIIWMLLVPSDQRF